MGEPANFHPRGLSMLQPTPLAAAHSFVVGSVARFGAVTLFPSVIVRSCCYFVLPGACAIQRSLLLLLRLLLLRCSFPLVAASGQSMRPSPRCRTLPLSW